MQFIKNMLALLFLIIFLPMCCEADWRSDLTKPGFYIVNGKAIYLMSKRYAKSDNFQSFSVSDFPIIPILKENNFLIFYGNIKNDEYYGLVDYVIGYEIKENNYVPNPSRLYGPAFFSIPIELIDSLRGQKVLKLTPRNDVLYGIYFLRYKDTNTGDDLYAGFRYAINQEITPMLYIKKDGTMFINQQKYVMAESLQSNLEEELSKDNKKKLFLKADDYFSYGSFVDVLNKIISADVDVLGIIFEKPPEILDVRLPVGTSTDKSRIPWDEGKLTAPIEIPDKFQGFIIFTLFNEGIYINGDFIKFEILNSCLKSIYSINQDIPIFIRAEARINFESVKKLIKTASNAGFKTISLIPEYFRDEGPSETEVMKENLIDKLKSEIQNYFIKKKSEPKQEEKFEP